MVWWCIALNVRTIVYYYCKNRKLGIVRWWHIKMWCVVKHKTWKNCSKMEYKEVKTTSMYFVVRVLHSITLQNWQNCLTYMMTPSKIFITDDTSLENISVVLRTLTKSSEIRIKLSLIIKSVSFSLKLSNDSTSSTSAVISGVWQFDISTISVWFLWRQFMSTSHDKII